MGYKSSGFTPISRLKKDNNGPEARNEKEIAATLLSSFFPSLPSYLIPQRNLGNSKISVPPLTEEDVKNAIFSASSFFAGRVDNHPSIVWQKLWQVLNNQIAQLFYSSLSQSRLPEQWKIAKIIPLRKPDQKSYILPGAYRPKSLLSTLEKAMESTISTRIGYLTDKHSLLPSNHFGGLKTWIKLKSKPPNYKFWRMKKSFELE